MVVEVSQDPRDRAFFQDPYPFYDRLRSSAPFFWTEFGHLCAADHKTVHAIFRDRRFGRIVPGPDGTPLEPNRDPRLAHFQAIEDRSLLELEPPAHTRLRGLVNRAFVSRNIEKLRGHITRFSEQLIDAFSGSSVDILEAFSTPIPIRVICAILGVDPVMSERYLNWSHKMVAMYQFGRNAEVEAAADQAAAEFAAHIRSEIALRRATPRDDLLTELVAASDAGQKLTEPEIVATAILLLNAGHEATVHSMGNGVKAILEAPLDHAALFATPEETSATVEETLRYDPPLHMFARYALEDLDIGEVPMKRGERIGLLLGAANRDPARYGDPHRFDPTRDSTAITTFGAGVHFCIGAPLARLEMEVSLPILFRRLPNLRIVEPPRYRDTYHFHGLERLAVTA